MGGLPGNRQIASTYPSSRTLILIVLVIALIAGLSVSFLLARSIARNVARVLHAAQGIADGDIEQDVFEQMSAAIGQSATNASEASKAALLEKLVRRSGCPPPSERSASRHAAGGSARRPRAADGSLSPASL